MLSSMRHTVFSYLRLRHSRSTKMLSMHRPLPSMLIVTPCRFRVPVKSSLVNWADSTDRRNTDLCWPIGRHRRPTPRCLTVTLDEFISMAGYHRKHVIWHRCFRRCWWPNLDKHSAVLGLVQDEPALRAGAASGILDKTCARRSAGGRSAPRNGPLSLTKECNLDLGSREAISEAMVTSQHGQFRTPPAPRHRNFSFKVLRRAFEPRQYAPASILRLALASI